MKQATLDPSPLDAHVLCSWGPLCSELLPVCPFATRFLGSNRGGGTALHMISELPGKDVDPVRLGEVTAVW